MITKSLVAKKLNINSRYVQGKPEDILERCSQRDLPFPVMRPYEFQGSMYMIPAMPENMTRRTYATIFFGSPKVEDLKRGAEQLGIKKKISKKLNRRNLMEAITGYMVQNKVKEPIFVKRLKTKADSCIIRKPNSNTFVNLNNRNSNTNSLVRKDENYLKNNLGLSPNQINNYRNANNKQNYLRNSVGLTPSQIRSVPVSTKVINFVKTPAPQLAQKIITMSVPQRQEVFNNIRRELPQATGGQLAQMKNVMVQLKAPSVKNGVLVNQIANAKMPITKTTIVEHKANKRVAELQQRINKLLNKEKKINKAKNEIKNSLSKGNKTLPASVVAVIPSATQSQNMSKILKNLENLKKKSVSERKSVATQAAQVMVKTKAVAAPGRTLPPRMSKNNLNRKAQQRKNDLNRKAQQRKNNLNRKAQQRKNNLIRRNARRKEKAAANAKRADNLKRRRFGTELERVRARVADDATTLFDGDVTTKPQEPQEPQEPVELDEYEANQMASFMDNNSKYPNKYRFSSANSPAIANGLGAGKNYDIRNIRNQMNSDTMRAARIKAQNPRLYNSIESKLKNVGEQPLKTPTNRNKLMGFANHRMFSTNNLNNIERRFETYRKVHGDMNINMSQVTNQNRSDFQKRVANGMTNGKNDKSAVMARVEKFLAKDRK